MKITITEALARSNTIKKRIEKKRENIASLMIRQEQYKDPAGGAGSEDKIAAELRSIASLEWDIVAIRTAINRKNDLTPCTVRDIEWQVAEWLVWKREVAPGRATRLREFLSTIDSARQTAAAKRVQVVGLGASPSEPHDVMILIDEADLRKEEEILVEILGELDGKLSLINATTYVEVAD